MDHTLCLALTFLFGGVALAAFARVIRSDRAVAALRAHRDRDVALLYELRQIDAANDQADADFALVLARMVRDHAGRLDDLDDRAKAVEGAMHEVSRGVRDDAVAGWEADAIAHGWDLPTL